MNPIVIYPKEFSLKLISQEKQFTINDLTNKKSKYVLL